MRCQPNSDRRHTNPPKARTHGGDYDIGCGGGGRYIGQRLPVGWRIVGQSQAVRREIRDRDQR